MCALQVGACDDCVPSDGDHKYAEHGKDDENGTSCFPGDGPPVWSLKIIIRLTGIVFHPMDFRPLSLCPQRFFGGRLLSFRTEV
jgi:hypothetical protein